MRGELGNAAKGNGKIVTTPLSVITFSPIALISSDARR
jgi:hypothetical protein